MRVILPVVVLSVLLASAAFSAPVEVVAVDLIAGQNTDIGTVTVYRDSVTNDLSVVIDTDEPWEIDATHLYIARSAPTKQSPGKFPYKHEDLGWVDEDTFDLGFLGTGTFYVAVHAEARENLGDADNDEDIDADDELLYPMEGAWAWGPSRIRSHPWATYFSINVPTID